MRITAGFLKGKEVLCPKGKNIRPTSSMSREGIFSVLYSLSFEINNIKILDLFAGTGIFSFETLSRGGAFATLVDKSNTSITNIKKNAGNLKILENISLKKNDVLDYLDSSTCLDFDLIFIDPPYRYENYQKIIEKIAEKIKNTSLVIIESGFSLSDKIELKNLKLIKDKKWGGAYFSFLQKH